MSVLGGMLIDPDAIVRAIEVVDESMFYREAHRRLFRAMLRLWETGGAIEPVSLAEQLKTAGDFDAVGGAAYLSQLWDYVPTAANLEYHAKIVREKALLRRLIDVSTTIIQDTYANQGEVERLLDEAEQRIFQIAQTHDRKGFVWIKELLWPAMEQIEILSQTGSAITGVPTGFADLDILTAGFQKGDLVIIAARPSMGKTALVTGASMGIGRGIAKAHHFGLEIAIRSEGPRVMLDAGLRDMLTKRAPSEGHIEPRAAGAAMPRRPWSSGRRRTGPASRPAC